LILSEVNDTSVYHFDSRRPIRFAETVAQARAEALAAVGAESEQDADGWWPAHPDHTSALG
jgi:hypothetical protein